MSINMIATYTLKFQTSGEGDIVAITPEVEKKVRESSIQRGSALVFLQSTTSSIVIIENEEGLLRDYRTAMERLAPKSASYEHEKAWHDGNGHSHMRATMMGQSLTIPFSEGSMLLGQWQEIILAEFDVRPRKRTVIVQIQGD